MAKSHREKRSLGVVFGKRWERSGAHPNHPRKCPGRFEPCLGGFRCDAGLGWGRFPLGLCFFGDGVAWVFLVVFEELLNEKTLGFWEAEAVLLAVAGRRCGGWVEE